MPRGWLYNREDMATVGRQISGTRCGRELDCPLSDRLLAISNRCPEDCSCAHKGLMTNWPHHIILRALCQDPIPIAAGALPTYEASIRVVCSYHRKIRWKRLCSPRKGEPEYRK